jgi:hypothetical protein
MIWNKTPLCIRKIIISRMISHERPTPSLNPHTNKPPIYTRLQFLFSFFSKDLNIKQQIAVGWDMECLAWPSHRALSVSLFTRHVKEGSLAFLELQNTLCPPLNQIHPRLERKRPIHIGAVFFPGRPPRWSFTSVVVLNVQGNMRQISVLPGNRRSVLGCFFLRFHANLTGHSYRQNGEESEKHLEEVGHVPFFASPWLDSARLKIVVYGALYVYVRMRGARIAARMQLFYLQGLPMHQ